MAFQKQCLFHREGTKKFSFPDGVISWNSIHVPVCLLHFLEKLDMNVLRRKGHFFLEAFLLFSISSILWPSRNTDTDSATTHTLDVSRQPKWQHSSFLLSKLSLKRARHPSVVSRIRLLEYHCQVQANPQEYRARTDPLYHNASHIYHSTGTWKELKLESKQKGWGEQASN